MRRTPVRPRVAVLAVGCVAGALLAGCAGAATPSSLPPLPTLPVGPPAPTSTSRPPAPPPGAAVPSSPSPSPPPSPAAVSECVQARLAAMAPGRRIGQLFLLGVPAVGLGTTAAVIARSAPGGVFLTGRSSAGVAATAAVSAAVRRAGAAASGGMGMFVATDQEGGEVQVLSGPGFSDIPSAAVQGGWPPARLEAAAADWGRQLRTAGVDVDLAPVADVLSPALGTASAPIGRYHRAFGTDPATVSAAAAAVVRGLARAGVGATAKHFPGLGRVQGNTDTSTGVTDRQTTPTDPDLEPFRSAVTAGAGWVMISSAVYSEIDASRPAVFSPTVIRTLLRGRLGFSGLVVSDDLGNARQVGYLPAGRRAVDFLAAGGDVVLTADPATLEEMVEAVAARVAADPVFAGHVADSEDRVVASKVRAGLVACPAPGG